MKYIFLIFTFIFFTDLSIAQTGSITVMVKRINSEKGFIRLGLFNSKEAFTVESKEFKGVILYPNKLGVSYKFDNIPVGIYALAVYHDENSNRKMDDNIFGVPIESYGFSLNKYGSFGPPSFEEVSFEVKENEDKSLIINLIKITVN